jgi:WhiB family redox-sensing transcriptional regulator
MSLHDARETPYSPHEPDTQPWADQALCAQTEPEAFFPDPGTNSTRAARRTCRACEVRAECLAWALERDERFGIWGGLTPKERRKLKKEAS